MSNAPVVRKRNRKSRNERGFFTVWTLGLCVCVLFIGGLIFDFCHAFSDRRALAAIVDAAAIAGANQIDIPQFQQSGNARLNESQARTAAANYAATAAAQEHLDLQSVNVEMQQNAIAVTATTKTQISLAAIFLGKTQLDVTVSGIADPRVSN